MWKDHTIHNRQLLKEDENYLISWWDIAEKKFSLPHKAYWLYERFFSLENNNCHPIEADIWMELPKTPSV